MKNGKLPIKSLVFLLAVLLMLAAGCYKDEKIQESTESGAAEIQTMTGEELENKSSTNEREQVLLIDVRSAEEYKDGHIPNAINISIEEMEERLGEIKDYKNKPIILYCNTGNRSGSAAEILANNGFTNITNAQGVKEYEYDLVN